jgi:hypothetical protein
MQVAIPNHDSREARIFVVSLEPKPNQPREREVVLGGHQNADSLLGEPHDPTASRNQRANFFQL